MSATTQSSPIGKAKIAEAVTAVTQATASAMTRGSEEAAGAVRAGVAQTTAGLETTQAKMKEGIEKAMKTAEDLVTFGQGNLEALTKSGQIWAAGVQDISKQVAVTAQASFDNALSTFRAIAAVKSLKDAIDLQANYARASVEKTLAESSRLTDASMRLAEQTVAPLTARMSVAVEKFTRSA